jgi:hypothetical protein
LFILAVACSGVSSENPLLHRIAQRAMVFNPRAQINAHKSAANIITMFVSKFSTLMNESFVLLLLYDGGILTSVSRKRRFMVLFVEILVFFV